MSDSIYPTYFRHLGNGQDFVRYFPDSDKMNEVENTEILLC